MNPPANSTTLYRVEQLERDVDVLVKKVDRLVWALIGLSISLATSAIVFAISVAVVRGA